MGLGDRIYDKLEAAEVTKVTPAQIKQILAKVYTYAPENVQVEATSSLDNIVDRDLDELVSKLVSVLMSIS